MSGWALSLTDLANQAEAFLEQVDKKAADSLQETDQEELSNEQQSRNDEGGSIFTSFSNTISFSSENIELQIDQESAGITSVPHSSPEVLPDQPDLISINSDNEDQADKEREHENGDTMSRLELENKLIRQEITQLTEEIGILSNKLRSYQEKLVLQDEAGRKQQETVGKLQEELRLNGRVVRGHKDKESDLNDAITAKDTQIGVLKVRLAEADAELASQSAALKNTAEDLVLSATLHTEVTTLRSELGKSNELVLEYRQQSAAAQNSASEREIQLKTQMGEVSSLLQTTEQQLNGEKRKFAGVISELKVSRSELEFARKDLNDYKERATRVLQSKDRKNTSDTSILDNDGVEMLIQERNHLEQQYRSVRSELDVMREHISSLEQVHSEELQQALDKCSSSDQVVREREQAISEYINSISQYKEEVFVCQRELSTVRSSALSDMRELREQLTLANNRAQNQAGGMSGESEGELTVKLKSLTEVLLNKQTEVERLASERSSLVMQLESLESLLQNVERKNNSVAIPIAKEGFVERKVSYKNERLRDALNSLDKFSIRLGVFLRRYPHARMMVICYMLLLHCWVMVVLLTYSPEIHEHET